MVKNPTPQLKDEFGCNQKEQLFVREYLKDFNGSAAAARAGWPKKTSAQHASTLLKKKCVINALQAAMRKRSEKVEVDAAWVLKQAVKLHRRCMQEIKPKLVWDKGEKEWVHDTDEDGNGIYIFNANGAAKSLELVGKHVDVQAFNEQSTLKTGLGAYSDEELHDYLEKLRLRKPTK